MSDNRQDAARRAKLLAHVLDESIRIPGTSLRIGLDAIVGLIPGVGDLIGGLLSTYIVAQAIDQGLPKATVLRMAVNVLVETVVGSVPVLGDLFDAYWKANVRNARLLETAIATERKAGRRDLGFLVAVVGGLVLMIVGAASIGVWLLTALRDFLVGLS
jgi:hypothetical protein